MTCRRCHHRLTLPLSIARGYGPTCWKDAGKQLALWSEDEPTLVEIADSGIRILMEQDARKHFQ